MGARASLRFINQDYPAKEENGHLSTYLLRFINQDYPAKEENGHLST